jgi:hypothetical protein
VDRALVNFLFWSDYASVLLPPYTVSSGTKLFLPLDVPRQSSGELSPRIIYAYVRCRATWQPGHRAEYRVQLPDRICPASLTSIR